MVLPIPTFTFLHFWCFSHMKSSSSEYICKSVLPNHLSPMQQHREYACTCILCIVTQFFTFSHKRIKKRVFCYICTDIASSVWHFITTIKMKSTKVQTLGAIALHATTACTDDLKHCQFKSTQMGHLPCPTCSRGCAHTCIYAHTIPAPSSHTRNYIDYLHARA